MERIRHFLYRLRYFRRKEREALLRRMDLAIEEGIRDPVSAHCFVINEVPSSAWSLLEMRETLSRFDHAQQRRDDRRFRNLLDQMERDRRNGFQ